MPQTILVVDDEPEIVKLVRAYLEGAGYRVVTAKDGREALLVTRHEKPDLIVLDLTMPEMDGIEFTRRLRQEKNTPIIILTARVEETDRIIGLELGADASRVEQVLGVLLDNALRHTPRGGQISVHLQPKNGEVWLSVRDTGQGIATEALTHVFERFYQSASPRPGGSGLGLAIAHAIVTAHGGRIWADSAPGRGTTMTLTLDL